MTPKNAVIEEYIREWRLQYMTSVEKATVVLPEELVELIVMLAEPDALEDVQFDFLERFRDGTLFPSFALSPALCYQLASGLEEQRSQEVITSIYQHLDVMHNLGLIEPPTNTCISEHDVTHLTIEESRSLLVDITLTLLQRWDRHGASLHRDLYDHHHHRDRGHEPEEEHEHIRKQIMVRLPFPLSFPSRQRDGVAEEEKNGEQDTDLVFILESRTLQRHAVAQNMLHPEWARLARLLQDYARWKWSVARHELLAVAVVDVSWIKPTKLTVTA